PALRCAHASTPFTGSAGRPAVCSISLLCPFSASAPGPPRATRFPYTTLFRSQSGGAESPAAPVRGQGEVHLYRSALQHWQRRLGDRKSTRLNSSHVSISYAVFCLKKRNSV